MLQKLLSHQPDRMQKTAQVLGVTTDKLRLFLAGECWDDGKHVVQLAQRAGYSVLYESGSDLTVLPAKECK
jgi:hypothetical protein